MARMSNKYSKIKWILAVIMLCLLTCGDASASLRDTMQNYYDVDNDGFGDSDDITNWVTITGGGGEFGGGGGGSVTLDHYGAPYSEVIKLRTSGSGSKFTASWGTASIYNVHGESSTYWAFTVRRRRYNYHNCEYWSYSGPGNHFYVLFYDSSGYLINDPEDPADILDYIHTYNSNDRYEIFIDGGIIYLRINGVDREVIDTCSGIPSYMQLEFDVSMVHSEKTNYQFYDEVWIDDITTEHGIVGVGMDTSTMGGFRNHTFTEMNNKRMDVSWAARTIPSSTYTSSEITLKVKNMKNGTFINTTILKEAGNSTAKPCGIVTYNWSTLFGENYGLYNFELYRDSILLGQDYVYYKTLQDDSWINIEKDQYGIGDTMSISYFLDNPDFSTNDYYIRIYDAGGEVQEMREITTSSGTEEFETLGYASGTAFAVLIKDTSPAATYEDDRDLVELGYDVTNMMEGVFIHGTTYNAETGQPLPNVSVVFTQGGKNYETTSDVNGTYNFEYQSGTGDITTNTTAKFAVDALIQVNASKSGYWHDNFSFTPLRSGTLTIDLYLLPNCENLTHTGYTIAGMTLSYPFHQAVGDASVHIENETTWSNDTTSSTDMGYYIFDNLPVVIKEEIENETFNSSEYDTWVSLVHGNIISGTVKVTNTTDETPFVENVDYVMDYTDGKIKVLSSGDMLNNTLYHIDYEYYTGNIYKFYTNATKSGYKPSSTYTTEFNSETEEECQYQNIILHGLYKLTIRAKDAETHFSLTDFSAIFNENEQKESGSNTYITFDDIEYGIWKVQVDKDGYYSQVKYVYVADDTNVTFYLTRMSNETQYPSGPGAYYAPHTVEFRFQDLFGNPVPGAIVNATPIETSLGSWDWLEKLYGYSSDVDLRNTTLSGETGTDGTVTFTMVDTIKYRVTVNDKQRGITKTIDIYPKDDHYTMVVGFLISSVNRDAEINATFTTHEINDTARVFNVLYIDTGNKTQSINFTVYAKPTDEVENFTLVYSEIKNGSTANFSYTAMNWRNTTYYIGYEATMDDGTKRSETRGYEYHMRHILWDLGLEEDEYQYYTWISIALLILVGAMFSGITVRYGAVFVPMFALLLWYVGWLRFAGDIGILGVAMVLGVLFYYKEKSREEAMG